MAHADLQTPGPDTPSSARIHNLWLGGSYYTPADERKAAEVEAICPQIRQMAADSRLLTARTVTWAAADMGISQFLDLGAGVPARSGGPPDGPVGKTRCRASATSTSTLRSPITWPMSRPAAGATGSPSHAPTWPGPRRCWRIPRCGRSSTRTSLWPS